MPPNDECRMGNVAKIRVAPIIHHSLLARRVGLRRFAALRDGRSFQRGDGTTLVKVIIASNLAVTSAHTPSEQRRSVTANAIRPIGIQGSGITSGYYTLGKSKLCTIKMYCCGQHEKAPSWAEKGVRVALGVCYFKRRLGCTSLTKRIKLSILKPTMRNIKWVTPRSMNC
jgi:hypothetical protein